ncbi:MAG: capsular biosynthesis protein [Flavobacteriales bacterium]|nr:capsular biosynthesis protein [Flavobacteriales bacterium]
MGFLDQIFRKKEVFPPVDLSILGADMHSHLIPRIDDGAQNIEQSILLIKSLKSFGFKKIITTPHIMSDYYKNTPDVINKGLDEVRERLVKEGIDIEIEAAAEYYVDSEFDEKVKSKDIMTFGEKYVLIEVSFLNEPEYLDNTIFNLQLAGYIPVLAHPERYPYWHDRFDKYHELRDKGVILQLNSNSIMGYYSPQMQSIARRMIDEDLIDFIGTDCHGERHLEALETCLVEGHLHKLLERPLLNTTL